MNMCRFCGADSVGSEVLVCDGCLDAGNLVGGVVWSFIEKAVQNAPNSDRVAFMVAGLQAKFIEGIVRKAPNGLIYGKSLKLGINPTAAKELDVPDEVKTYESPVHWRHNNSADVVLFAPSDTERDSIGAGLGSLAQIDSALIMEQLDSWVDIFEESGGQNAYLYNMLKGLSQSGVCIDLEMWVEFIQAIKQQGFDKPVSARVQSAVYALQIPVGGVEKLPRLAVDSKEIPPVSQFKTAFSTAKSEVSVYAMLVNPKHEPIDIGLLNAKLAELESENGDEEPIDEDLKVAISVTRDLIASRLDIKPGEWTPAQNYFCRFIYWDRYGKQIFNTKRKNKSKKLGQATLEYIRGDYDQDLSEELEKFLDRLDDSDSSGDNVSEEEERLFFEKWRDRLSHTNASHLYKQWHKRVFNKEIVAQDLLVALLQGLEALISEASDDVGNIAEPRVLIRADQHNKASYWQSLDKRIHQFFCFEVSSAKKLLEPIFLWDIEKCFSASGLKDQGSKNSRTVSLEMYLISSDQLTAVLGQSTKLPSAPRVKVVWQPEKSARDTPISLSVVNDFEQLSILSKSGPLNTIPKQSFSGKTHNAKGKQITPTLQSVTSFFDVSETEMGRTVDAYVQSGEPILDSIFQIIERLKRSHEIEVASASRIESALGDFSEKYAEAVNAIFTDSENAFHEKLIETQAHAFALLCSNIIDSYSVAAIRNEVMPLVARIGVVATPPGERKALIALWHPLRLLEKKTKICDFKSFTQSLFDNGGVSNHLNSVAFEDRKRVYERSYYPECTVLSNETYAVTEDLSGYSLLVPVDELAKNQSSLDRSAVVASNRFIKTAEDYLKVFPHESHNLSLSLFNSNSRTLKRALVESLHKLTEATPELRLELSVSDSNQNNLRSNFSDQEALFGARENHKVGDGFLSRFRLSIKSPTTSSNESSVREHDLVLLHESVSAHSKTHWDFEVGARKDLPQEHGLSSVSQSRRRVGDHTNAATGVYLTLRQPSSSLAAFYDLLYILDKNTIVPDGHHAVLVNSVGFDDEAIKNIVSSAHFMGEWVVTVDSIANRQLLKSSGVKIIRDISLPGQNTRIIVSALTASKTLRSMVENEVMIVCDLAADQSVKASDRLLSDVVEISGQKILSAARNENAARELIGLCVSKSIMRKAWPTSVDPIWISLDDYRGWFTQGSGRIADMVGITIDHDESSYVINLYVGEAKFVSSQASAKESSSSLTQVKDTVARLKAIFVDNADPVSKAAWCSRLSDLLVNRDEISRLIRDPRARSEFFELMSRGAVAFKIAGESIVCIHDSDVDDVPPIEDPDFEYVRQFKVGRNRISQVIKSLISDQEFSTGISAPKWLDVSPKSPTKAQEEDGVINRSVVSDKDISDEMGSDGATEGNIGPASTQPGEMNHLGVNTSSFTIQESEEPINEDEADKLELHENIRFMPPDVQRALVGVRASVGSGGDSDEDRKWAEETCSEAQKALSHFNMHAAFSDPKYRLTPNGILVNFKGHPSLTLNGLEKRKQELLTTYGIQVIDLRGGPGFISLFIQRPKRAKIDLASTLLDASWPERSPGELTNFIIGVREDNGELLYMNLEGEYGGYEEHGPHALIAGETKSGKGVLTQSLLLQLVTFNSPKNARLILIDPKKGVDFSWISEAPHLKGGIITDIDNAQSVFFELVEEMDNRYEVLAEKGCANLSEYNNLVPDGEKLPRIYLVHDEIGAWMAQEKEYRETVLSSVSNLGMKARAAGIHIILITQRADVEAVPGRLRDNLGNRLCLRVQNSTGSQMILNCNGAEKLLGRGHLAATFTGEANPPGQNFFVAQVPFLPNSDVAKIAREAIKFWSGNDSGH